jgi:hypothetical protein
MDPIRATLLQGILIGGGVGADELHKPILDAMVAENLLWIQTPVPSFPGEAVPRPIYRLTEFGRIVALGLNDSGTSESNENVE